MSAGGGQVLATAGHVDHGKSTLIEALTGTDPDRWAEEKARGLTIDLGFAHLDLGDGVEASVIDVPGHVRFLRNMLAGVGAVRSCLFVVSATEGWKPQSEEHLRILDVLGVEAGVLALTMVDLADDDLVELATLEVAERVEGTFLEDAAVVPVASPSGIGLDELRRALRELLAGRPGAPDRGRARLWVDRSFAPTGVGTVVTGTLLDGRLQVGEDVVLLPHDRPARIRSLQSHFADEEALRPGRRAAVALTGVDHGDVERGDALVRPGQWHRTTVVDAELRVLDGLDHPVSRRGAYLAYLGAGEHAVRLRVLGPDRIEPGQRGAVRLHLPTALPLVPGDRFVLRESGRAETVGGGEVLDVDPVLRAAEAAPDRSVERVVRERGRITVDDLELRTGVRVEATVGDWVADEAVVDATRASLRDDLAAAGPLGLDLAPLDDWERAVLDTLDGIEVVEGRAREAGRADPLADHPWLAALEAAPFTPPGAEGVDRREVAALVRRGLVVEADGNWYARSALDRAARVVAELLAERPDGATVAEVRDALGTTRKHALPLLNLLDAEGVTRRRGDLRIPGPRLPAPE